MNSAICTLFEGHYHYGVAALVNSLYTQGYRGDIYAGYRGSLPAWTSEAKDNPTLHWYNSRTLSVSEGLQLHFIPLDTDYHLTNYKPDFMLRLWNDLAREAKSIFYFDPDIIVTVPWVLFEEWVACGVTLCEDVNSPLSENHPVRSTWRRYFGSDGFTLRFKNSIYVNGGFVGVGIGDKGFLLLWQSLQESMAPAIGGLNKSAFTGSKELPVLPLSPFARTDQDALNATVEAWEGVTSLIGQEGMGFKSGPRLMSHALGHLKPWLINPLTQAIIGQRPRLADHDYWLSANGPIKSQPESLIKWRKVAIRVAALISRFYSRN
jgi:hypothetical protein